MNGGPNLLDLEEPICRLESLALTAYWLGRADERPDGAAVRVVGECLEEAAADLRQKWERLYCSQGGRP